MKVKEKSSNERFDFWIQHSEQYLIVKNKFKMTFNIKQNFLWTVWMCLCLNENTSRIKTETNYRKMRRSNIETFSCTFSLGCQFLKLDYMKSFFVSKRYTLGYLTTKKRHRIWTNKGSETRKHVRNLKLKITTKKLKYRKKTASPVTTTSRFF